MNKTPNFPSNDDPADIAQIIFDKGRTVHQRIDRIVRDIMVNKNSSVKNLTIAQADVIMEIHQAGTISITELAKILGVSAPSVSTMVDRMVEKKLLLRTRDDQDRRKVVICLSSETQQQIYQVEQAVLQMFTDLIAKVGSEIGELWCKVLITVEKVLDDHPQIGKPYLQSDGVKNDCS